MTRKTQRNWLKAVVCLLSLVLLGMIGIAVLLSAQALPGQPTGPQLNTQEQTLGTTVPTTAPATQPTTVPEETTAPTTMPEETTEPTTVPTEPEPEVFTLSFAGDCTLGNQLNKSGEYTFIGTVGDNYAYPFADVQDYFATDDCTFVNLECALTDGGNANTLKLFTFKGPAAYTNILTEGSVEFANIVNNHSKDYGNSGYKDTMANLDAAGVFYADWNASTVFTTESGLTIGVYSAYFPSSTWGMTSEIEALRAAGAEIVVVAVHWGEEYDYHPNSTEKKLGRQYIDAGADIVWGHHPHVLQDMEEYNGGLILYSMGNFSFGGNSNPSDKDTAIVQVQIIRQPDGTVERGELTIIPCYVSGILTYGNDYQPTPMPEDADGYQRVLQKLNGSYPKENGEVPYRENQNTTQPTEGESAPEETTAPPETVPEETTVPVETEPEATQPVETEPQPTETEPQPSDTTAPPAEEPAAGETPPEDSGETPTE